MQTARCCDFCGWFCSRGVKEELLENVEGCQIDVLRHLRRQSRTSLEGFLVCGSDPGIGSWNRSSDFHRRCM